MIIDKIINFFNMVENYEAEERQAHRSNTIWDSNEGMSSYEKIYFLGNSPSQCFGLIMKNMLWLHKYINSSIIKIFSGLSWSRVGWKIRHQIGIIFSG